MENLIRSRQFFYMLCFCLSEDFFLRYNYEEDNYEDRSEEYEIIYSNMVPSDASLQRAPFVVRDFIVCRYSTL